MGFKLLIAKPMSSALFQGLLATHNYHYQTGFIDMLRPHQCSFCGRRFKRKDHRVEHERIHTGERPFVCTNCGRAFIQKHQLISHIKRRHNNEDAGANVGRNSGYADRFDINVSVPSNVEFQNNNDDVNIQSQFQSRQTGLGQYES